jgi:peptidoglycan/xylan/chitin deacetylase (PgdA/CDA1 family)
MLQYSYRRNSQAVRQTRRDADQSWMDYWPIVSRPPIRWPGSARVALWICPCALHFEFMPPADPWIDSWARTPPPDVLGYGRQEYGNRVGIWRLFEILDAHQTRCTMVVNAQVLERYPAIAKAIAQRGWDILGHGIVNTRFIFGLSEDDERAYYRDMRDRVEAQTGIRMAGTGGPGPQAATEATVDIVAELGFRYHGDWFCDDQPVPLRVRSGRLIALPYASDINDAGFLGTAFEADDFVEATKRQFDQLYAEGAENGRILCITLHPHIFGQPQRVRYLDELLSYLRSFPDVWHATGAEIADYYFANYYDEAAARLGLKEGGR